MKAQMKALIVKGRVASYCEKCELTTTHTIYKTWPEVDKDEEAQLECQYCLNVKRQKVDDK